MVKETYLSLQQEMELFKKMKVTYANTDSFFNVIEFDAYDARGEFAGEGVILDNFLGEKGYASNSTSNIQDSKFYQSFICD